MPVTPAVYPGCFILPSILSEITPASMISGRISSVQISLRLRGHKVPLSSGNLLSSPLRTWYGKRAWLCASSTVAAPASEDAAHQALSRKDCSTEPHGQTLRSQYYSFLCMAASSSRLNSLAATTRAAPCSSRNFIPSGPVTAICVLAWICMSGKFLRMNWKTPRS